MKRALALGVLLAAIPSLALGYAALGPAFRCGGALSASEGPPPDLPVLHLARPWPSVPPSPHTETIEVVEVFGEHPLERFAAALFLYPYPPGWVGTPEDPRELGDGLRVAEIGPLADGARSGVLSFDDRDGDGLLSAGDRFTVVGADPAVCDFGDGDGPCEATWDVYEFGLYYRGYGFYGITWPVVLVPLES